MFGWLARAHSFKKARACKSPGHAGATSRVHAYAALTRGDSSPQPQSVTMNAGIATTLKTA